MSAIVKRETPYYQKRLREELQRRCEKNPRYSIRAFAASIGIESSSLSQVLNGTRAISARLVERIFGALEFSPEEQKAFIDSVIEKKRSTGRGTISGKLQARSISLASHCENSSAPRLGIGTDAFRTMSEWYHSAILELTFSPNFKSDPRWIASALNISITDAKLAVARLLELDLLEEQDGKLKKTHASIQTTDQSKTSLFHKRRQRQILEKSIFSLENDPIEERNHSGVTLCLNPDQIPEAKLRIQSFLWEMATLLEKGPQSRVYEFTINLFPLQKKEKP